MAGEHFFDGFLKNFQKEKAKEAIHQILLRLNDGEPLTPADVGRELKPFLVS